MQKIKDLKKELFMQKTKNNALSRELTIFRDMRLRGELGGNREPVPEPAPSSFTVFRQRDMAETQFYKNLTSKTNAEYGAFICPLTMRLFCEPVVAADGHTYEKRAVEEFLRTNSRSPVTGNLLRFQHVYPNNVLK